MGTRHICRATRSVASCIFGDRGPKSLSPLMLARRSARDVTRIGGAGVRLPRRLATGELPYSAAGMVADRRQTASSERTPGSDRPSLARRRAVPPIFK